MYQKNKGGEEVSNGENDSFSPMSAVELFFGSNVFTKMAIYHMACLHHFYLYISQLIQMESFHL